MGGRATRAPFATQAPSLSLASIARKQHAALPCLAAGRLPFIPIGQGLLPQPASRTLTPLPPKKPFPWHHPAPPGFRERLLADPSFLIKVGIEVCVWGGIRIRTKIFTRSCSCVLLEPTKLMGFDSEASALCSWDSSGHRAGLGGGVGGRRVWWEGLAVPGFVSSQRVQAANPCCNCWMRAPGGALGPLDASLYGVRASDAGLYHHHALLFRHAQLSLPHMLTPTGCMITWAPTCSRTPHTHTNRQSLTCSVALACAPR